MVRQRCALGLVALLLASSVAAGQPSRPSDLLALEESFQEAIKKAEPSIACILVSRSDLYQRWFGQKSTASDPGKLGDFYTAQVALQVPPGDHAQVEEIRKALEKKANRFDINLDRELKRMVDLADVSNVPEAYGSGVVIHESGLILTNYHVVRDATKLYVRLPGGKGSYVDIHAADPRSDLAVLRVLDPKILPLPAIKRGAGGTVRKGQIILSLANPFAAGFRDGSPSASWGIISNLRRRAPGGALWEQDRAKATLHHYGTLLQTDARLNLGCSGGALIDLKGELIGLTTALAALSGSETSGGYAIPLDAGMCRIIDVLEKGEEVEYGFLGVGFKRETRRGEEVQVNVIEGSPAQRPREGGVLDGDTIISVNGIPIRENDDLFLSVGTLLAGSKALLEIRSHGQKRIVSVILDKYYVPGKIIASRKPPLVHGIRVDYSSVLFQRDGTLSRIPKGVCIIEVKPGSPADEARLQDAVVTQVNGMPIGTPADFYLKTASLTGPVELTIVNRTDSGNSRKVKLN